MIKELLIGGAFLFALLPSQTQAYRACGVRVCEEACSQNIDCENCSYTHPLKPYPNPFEYPDNMAVTYDSDRADPYGDVGYRFS